MKVLYCASEAAPIVKVGGLGDVAGSLPKALAKLGVEISVVVPKYEEIGEIGPAFAKASAGKGFEVEFDGKDERVTVWETKLPGSQVRVYLLENEKYLSKDGHQAFRGNKQEIERFAFFSKAIAELVNHRHAEFSSASPYGEILKQVQDDVKSGFPSFDLLHLNDWHTSLVPLLLAENCQLSTLLTIHNLSYQGLGGLGILEKLELGRNECRALRWDAQNRDIDFLMEGIIHADFVNTVSPAYAREMMTAEFGNGIEEVLKGKEGRVSGILNGIDDEVWNPYTDEFIKKRLKSRSGKCEVGSEIEEVRRWKWDNKRVLQKELGLAVNKNTPLLAFIGRLEPKQKGLDILYEAMAELLPKKDFQFVLLGTGDPQWEEQFNNLAIEQSSNFKFINKFDEKLARQIYAGADFILMPSKFEPCGLPQMIGMRYGTLPLVRKTGGLADSVIDGKTGFVFEEYSGKALAEKIKEAIDKFSISKHQFSMIKEAMSQDFSWDKSAKDYLDLYKKVVESHN